MGFCRLGVRRLVAILITVVAVFGGVLAPPAPAAAQGEACFAETGFCIRGRFLAYWTANGGLARNGFPLSEERRELLEDGREYTVQYFERVRLEHHPEHPPPYDVLLGQFGRRVLLGFGQRLGGPAEPLPGETVAFPQTGQSLSGRFLDYWRQNGGLAQFGYPISGTLRQSLEDGNTYTVQYFERARFELHPEHAPPYDVLLGQFGRRILAESELVAEPFRRVFIVGGDPVRLVRPDGPAEVTPATHQRFEWGAMVYRADMRRILVLCGYARQTRESGVTVLSFGDTWEPSQPVGGGPGPAPGLYEPTRGFGKLWRENAEVRDCLGYAIEADEAGYMLTSQTFVTTSFPVTLTTRPDGDTAYRFFRNNWAIVSLR